MLFDLWWFWKSENPTQKNKTHNHIRIYKFVIQLCFLCVYFIRNEMS